MKSSGGGRQRASSFHEDFERPVSPVNTSSNSASNILSNSNNPSSNNQNRHTSSNNSRQATERSVEYMTPQFRANGPPEPLDLSQFEDENEDNDEENDDDNNEEELYSRGRSRSHSMHQNDGSSLPLPSGVVPDNGIIHVDPSTIPVSSNENKSFEKLERTGPLHQREVKALKLGLEQATHSRNKEELLEEEQERKDAEAERLLRLGAAAHAHNPQALNMTDPVTRKVKILLLGDSGVGKSSLIMRWTLDTFSATLVGTVGVNFKSKRVHVNGEPIQVQVWDTAGQEQFHKITTSYYRGANAIIVVFDVTDPKSLQNTEYWIKNIKAHASDTVHVILVGNKTDLRTADKAGPCINTETGKAVADKFSVPYFETSAKDSANVDNAFMSPVRSIVAADSKTTTEPIDNNRHIDKTKKMGLLDKLLKDKSTTSKAAEQKPTGKGESTDRGPDEKEKCIIS